MDTKELKQLAQKYLNKTATPEEKDRLNQWYDTIHKQEYELIYNNNPESKEQVRNRLLSQLKQKAGFKENSNATITSKTGRIRKFVISLLSAAAVFTAVFFIWQQNPNSSGISQKQLVSVPAKKIIHIVLPDGSKVWLNAGSIFKYPEKFDAKVRIVELVEGHAFLEIKHQNKQPFIVKTKNLNITVLGTSFDVRAYKNEITTKVSVVTGKVGITMKDEPKQPAIILLPKQQVVLSKISHTLSKETTPEIAVNVWCKSNLVFEQEELKNVFKVLEKKYNTKINVTSKKLLKERISITLGDQHIDTILDILSFTKHFKYTIANDSTIIIR